jgi:hypothetical protein
MKVKSSLIVPFLATSVLLPTAGNAILHDKTDNTNPSWSMEEGSHWDHNKKGRHHEGEQDKEKQKEIMGVINQYAPTQLKDKLKNDFTSCLILSISCLCA